MELPDQKLTSFIIVPYHDEHGREMAFMLGYLVRVIPECEGTLRLCFSDTTSAVTTDSLLELQQAIDAARTKAAREFIDSEVEANSLNLIFMEITAERERQDAQWGGPEHDDEHTWRDWKMIMIRQLGRLTMDHDLTVEYVHDKFLKAASIAAAAMQSMARKGKI